MRFCFEAAGKICCDVVVFLVNGYCVVAELLMPLEVGVGWVNNDSKGWPESTLR